MPAVTIATWARFTAVQTQVLREWHHTVGPSPVETALTGSTGCRSRCWGGDVRHAQGQRHTGRVSNCGSASQNQLCMLGKLHRAPSTHRMQ